ncbi:hypothetical protein [Acrocarpospora sp. B8E8]|uniref:hypothetical protein n=1 Tax=Acrocarpospora sp. B8E8 TaxID=3153572 RepID=UPI00325C87BF
MTTPELIHHDPRGLNLYGVRTTGGDVLLETRRHPGTGHHSIEIPDAQVGQVLTRIAALGADDHRAATSRLDCPAALLHWLIAAGVDITIGAAKHQGTAVIRVALDLDGPITLYGCNLAGLLAQARAWCEYEGITP